MHAKSMLWRGFSRKLRLVLTAVVAAAVILGLLQAPARAADDVPGAPCDRAAVVELWRSGGPELRIAAEAALVGPDDAVCALLSGGAEEKRRADERIAVTEMMAGGGPTVREAAQRALDAGTPGAVTAFLQDGWYRPSLTDRRVRVNQMMAVGGPQLRAAAQRALDAGTDQALQAFLDSGWNRPYELDQRLRVNQIMAAGGPQVRTAGQRALDAGTVEALDKFITTEWEVAAARDQEQATLRDLTAAAVEAAERATQETQKAVEEAQQALSSAIAARLAAEAAVAAAASAENNANLAKAAADIAAEAANRAATAADKAVGAARAAAASARVAANAAARAAGAAADAGGAASSAYGSAALAAIDAAEAAEARAQAQGASAAAISAGELRRAAERAALAGSETVRAAEAAKRAGDNAKAAGDSARVAAGHAERAGVNAATARRAAASATASAERAAGAAREATEMAGIAAGAATIARNAADRAKADAEAAAAAARDAADHAGEAEGAAQRAAAAANAASAAADRSVAAAEAATEIYDRARGAEDQRLLAAFEQGRQAAQAAAAEAARQKAKARWDAEQTRRRSEETNRLLAVAADPSTPPAEAVAAARKAGLALVTGPGAATQAVAEQMLAGSDALVLGLAKTTVAQATARDDRATVATLAATGSGAMRTAAEAASKGTDAQVREFLRTQSYPEREQEDRLRVNQIQAGAREEGQTTVVSRAQQALDGDAAALRAFIVTGHAEALTVDNRIAVNRVLADPATGREEKAEAQIALDGPDGLLTQFLTEGRYAARQRDQDWDAHENAVTALLLEAKRAAAGAEQDAELAQEAAAIARDAADEAAGYARAAQAAAERAAGFARQADASADRAQVSAERAAASARTARAAAASAAASAKRAQQSAGAAQWSFRVASGHARRAAQYGKQAYDSAVAAGQDALAAKAAYDAAYAKVQPRIDEATLKRGQFIQSVTEACADRYYFDDRLNAACRKRFADVMTDPGLTLYKRASVICDFIYPRGTEGSKACALDAFSPFFEENQAINLVQPFVVAATALLAAGAALQILAIGIALTPVFVAACRVACGALLTSLEPALIGETITMSAYLTGIGRLTILTGVAGIRFGTFLEDVAVRVGAAVAKFLRVRQLVDDLRNLGKLGPTEIPDELKHLTRDWDRYGGISPDQFVRKYWDPTVRNPDGSFGNWNWAKARGDAGVPTGGTPYRPRAGEEWDGFAGPSGPLLHPLGTPFTQRSLPPGSLASYVRYRWLKDWDEAAGAVLAGRTPPGFEQPGGGTQFQHAKTLDELERLGYIQRVAGSSDEWERQIAAVIGKYQLDDEVVAMLRRGRADPATVDRLLGRGLDAEHVALAADDFGVPGLRLLDVLTDGVASKAQAIQILQDAFAYGRQLEVEAIARSGLLSRLLSRDLPAEDVGKHVYGMEIKGLEAVDLLMAQNISRTDAVGTAILAADAGVIDELHMLAANGSRIESLNEVPILLRAVGRDAAANSKATEFNKYEFGAYKHLEDAAARVRSGHGIALEKSTLPPLANPDGKVMSEADIIDKLLRHAIQLKAVTAATPSSPTAQDAVVTRAIHAARQLAGSGKEWPPVGYRRIAHVIVLNPRNQFYGLTDRADILARLKANDFDITYMRVMGDDGRWKILVEEVWITNGHDTFKFTIADFE
jgi:hypothetical protein